MAPRGQRFLPRAKYVGAIAAVILGVALVFVSRSEYALGSNAEVLTDVTYWPRIPDQTRDRSQIGQENACIYMLVRNEELHEALGSIRQIEDRFNRRYRYPWVFLNDKPFTEEFVAMTSGMVSGKAEFGWIPPEIWQPPNWINRTYMEERIEQMIKDDVIYGGSRSYRNMCRFNSGYFFRHELLQPFDWYWRVEPGIDLFCDQLYDPFEFLRRNDKVYGFVMTFHEIEETVQSLWTNVSEWITDHPQHIAVNNALSFVTSFGTGYQDYEDGSRWNFCHFWSNFEIGSLKFFRSPEYLAFFDYLDRSGGFYYQRWGDASVHTLGLAAIANISQIHHFADIGYYHLPFWRCPHDDASYTSGRCWCPADKSANADFQEWSCLPWWYHEAGRQFLFNFGPK